MPKYLDLDGLTYLWGKITSKFVAKETGKGLSTNDFTTAEKTKLAGIEAGAEVNDIEVISVNGIAQTILQGKRVNITVPTSTSELTNDQIYELGTITTQNGIFVPTSQQITDIIAMWNRGFCGVHFVESSKDYYVFKQRVINFNGTDFYAFANSYAESNAFNIPVAGTTVLGISQSGYGMFGNIMDMTDDGVQTVISTYAPSSTDTPLMDGTANVGSSSKFAYSDHVHPTDTSRQATLVSGTNIKTINGTSILGSGDLTVGGGTTDYTDLNNKPTVNSVTLTGNKTASDLGLQNAIEVVTKTASDTTNTLEADKFYIFPTMTTLSVTVTATGMYTFRFTSGSTATTLTVTGATMPDSFTVEANKVYEINIYQGYGVASSWTVS